MLPFVVRRVKLVALSRCHHLKAEAKDSGEDEKRRARLFLAGFNSITELGRY
jgi:hypothetical protein